MQARGPIRILSQTLGGRPATGTAAQPTGTSAAGASWMGSAPPPPPAFQPTTPAAGAVPPASQEAPGSFQPAAGGGKQQAPPGTAYPPAQGYPPQGHPAQGPRPATQSYAPYPSVAPVGGPGVGGTAWGTPAAGVAPAAAAAPPGQRIGFESMSDEQLRAHIAGRGVPLAGAVQRADLLSIARALG